MTGFLGKIKTNILNDIMKNLYDLHAGILVTEITSVGIYANMIFNPCNDGEIIGVVMGLGGNIELHNGCECLSLLDKLLRNI